jgi:Peptidase family M48
MNEPILFPQSYHREIRDYLKSEERELWQWFVSARARENYAEDLRLSLLKSTYRLTPESHPLLHEQAASAARALGLTIPVALYQAQTGSTAPNAALYYLPGEAHIVLSGPIITLLDPVEFTSVLGHELAHHLLWQLENEEFLIADRVLHAVADDAQAHSVHHETARRYRLHTEIFADRGAAQVTQNLPAVVSALVKIGTGLSQVSGENYLAQAAEIFAKGSVTTDELSHPESFMRAHALSLWTRQGEEADATIRAMIAGEPGLDGLDLGGQHQISRLTRRFLEQLLLPRWFQSETILAHARLFFPDFKPAAEKDADLVEDLRATRGLLKTYFAYLLLDFARLDRDLEEVPLAAALRWAEELGIASHVEKLVTKELGVPARELSKLKPRITDLLTLAEKSA